MAEHRLNSTTTDARTRKRPRGEKREIRGWRRELLAQAQRGGEQGGNYEPWVGRER